MISVDIKYDTQLGKIWIDEISPIIYIKLQDTDYEFSEYHDLYKVYVGELKGIASNHKEVYVSLDLSDLTGVDEEIQIRNCGQFLRYLLMDIRKMKVKLFAVTISPNKFLQLIMDDILKTQPAVKVEWFETFYKAAKHLDTLRIVK